MERSFTHSLQNMGVLICAVIFSLLLVINVIQLFSKPEEKNIISITVPKRVSLMPRQEDIYKIYNAVPLKCNYSSVTQNLVNGTINSQKNRFNIYRKCGITPSSNDFSDSMYVWERGYFRYWEQKKTLNIFAEKNDNEERLISPGSEGVYEFIVYSSVNFETDYILKITYENQYNIPLLFRLRKDNNYLAGSETLWLTSEELSQNIKSKIPSGSENLYSLDWKWPFYINENKDQKDTFLGVLAINNLVEFILNFHFCIEQAGPEDPNKPIFNEDDKVNKWMTTGNNLNMLLFTAIIFSIIVLLILLLVNLQNKKRGKGEKE